MEEEDAPVAELAVPGAQETHAVWPALAYVPGVHALHSAATADWPGGGLTLPAAHVTHAAADVAA